MRNHITRYSDKLVLTWLVMVEFSWPIPLWRPSSADVSTCPYQCQSSLFLCMQIRPHPHPLPPPKKTTTKQKNNNDKQTNKQTNKPTNKNILQWETWLAGLKLEVPIGAPAVAKSHKWTRNVWCKLHKSLGLPDAWSRWGRGTGGTVDREGERFNRGKQGSPYWSVLGQRGREF